MDDWLEEIQAESFLNVLLNHLDSLLRLEDLVKEYLSELRQLRSIRLWHAFVGLLNKSFPSRLILLNIIWEVLKVLQRGQLTHLMPSLIVYELVGTWILSLLNLYVC